MRISASSRLPGTHRCVLPGNLGRNSLRGAETRQFGLPLLAGPADQRHLYYENHHKYAALPQITAGRLFLEGPRRLAAFDVYTGRPLWQWQPGEDDTEPWSYHIESRPEVEFLFEPLVGRMVSSHDAVYVVSGGRLYAIDAATGQPLANFAFKERADWGAPRIVGDRIGDATRPAIISRVNQLVSAITNQECNMRVFCP